MCTNQRRVRVVVVIGLATATAACAAPGVIDLRETPPGAVICPSYGADASATVGSGGDTIYAERRTAAGTRRHELIIPPGAIPSGEQLTFRLIEPANGFMSVQVVHSGSENRKFDRSLTLRLGYTGCTVPDLDGLGIYKWLPSNPRGQRWVRLGGSSHFRAGAYVEVPRDTLSEYALGAG